MDRINTIFHTLFALCHNLSGRFDHLCQRIMRSNVEQATMNQGLIESLTGAQQKIRDLEAQQAVLEQRLSLLERGAGVKLEGSGCIKREVKHEPNNYVYRHVLLDNLKQEAQRIVRWVKDSAAGQREINIEHAHAIRELRKRCSHLGNCVDTGVEDRDAADNALEERIEALESLLGIGNDEQETSPSARDSASAQYLDRFTLLEEEHNRMKRQLEVQTHELKALKARVNTQRSGQSAQSYEVNEELGRARSSNKKRKVIDTNDREGPATVTYHGIWTHEYKLYIERKHRLVHVGCSPLVDA
ncbi:hypothetical protein KCU77_g1928, partial [Aureobasidium melanogenum]